MNFYDEIMKKSFAKPDKTIRQHTDELKQQAGLLKSLDYFSSPVLYDEFFDVLMMACEYHDYGKANFEFQNRIKRKNRFNPANEIPHNVLSSFFIKDSAFKEIKNAINKRFGSDKKSAAVFYERIKCAVFYSIIYHHYNKESPINILNNELDLVEELLENLIDDFEDVVDETADDILDLLNHKYFNIKRIEDKLDIVLLKGFLHKCDYNASAGIECEIKNDFLNKALDLWKIDKEPNKLQLFCQENFDTDIIVTAPTGMGKTEAGLMWCGDNKCFFVLPLKSAINAMYKRLKNMAGNNYKDRVALLHSDMKSYYYKEDNEKKDNETDFDMDYVVKSKQMSLPITVCTPDQIFDFVLKYPGYEYKLAVSSYSKFIIDEIQMYSPDVLAAIIYGIKLTKAVGGKIAVLTATLPPFVRNELTKILGECPSADFSAEGIDRHNMQVFEKIMESDDIIEKIESTKSENVKKYLIVCNTIDIANEIFEQLDNYYEDTDVSVNIFHSRFTKKDRMEKEEKIMAASNDRTKTEIWISTSVVEASLDIDFDILFTQLSNLFSLFQRFGRVNRKGEKSTDKVNCYVYTELHGNSKKGDDEIHKLSKEGLMSIDSGIISELKKKQLIDEFLSAERIMKTDYAEKYNKYLKAYEENGEYINNDRKIRDFDTTDVIPIDVYNKNKDCIKNDYEVIMSRESTYEQKLKATDDIYSFTVSIDVYRLKNNISEKIQFGYKKNIYVIENCTYDSKRGLIFLKNKEEKTSDGNNML